MTIRYQTTRADDAGLRQRVKAIAQERRRSDYRRLHVLLKREGYVISHKKLFRLYREEKLAVTLATLMEDACRVRLHLPSAPG